MKQLLSTDDLIFHMKEKGITFEYVSENEAKEFIKYHNYYLKLSAYRFNYQKFGSGHPSEGKYQGLDFGCLKELSILDLHLRYIVLEMCLDIEHAIKVKLVNEVTNNPYEDGYNIVRSYLKKEDPNFNILKNINRHKSGEYCKDLIDKYYPIFPIWVLVELISFGDLIHICDFYKETYNKEILIDNKFINIIRDLRNASAHNNCLMNKMLNNMEETKQPAIEITSFLKNFRNISKNRRQKYLHKSFPYNLVTLFYVYDKYIPDLPKEKRYREIENFMKKRVVRHKEYFSTNPQIVALYKFLLDVVDNLNSRE